MRRRMFIARALFNCQSKEGGANKNKEQIVSYKILNIPSLIRPSYNLFWGSLVVKDDVEFYLLLFLSGAVFFWSLRPFE